MNLDGEEGFNSAEFVAARHYVKRHSSLRFVYWPIDRRNVAIKVKFLFRKSKVGINVQCGSKVCD